jgi:hypothetical protein
MQLMLLTVSFDMNWVGIFEVLLSKTGSLDVVSTQIFSLDCLLESLGLNSVMPILTWRLLISFILPIISAVILYVTWAIAQK